MKVIPFGDLGFPVVLSSGTAVYLLNIRETPRFKHCRQTLSLSTSNQRETRAVARGAGTPENAGHHEREQAFWASVQNTQKRAARKPGGRRQTHTCGLPSGPAGKRPAEENRPARDSTAWSGRCPALSPPPKPGGNSADTHAGQVSEREWPGTRRWRGSSES